jgi:hypothetical protein
MVHGLIKLRLSLSASGLLVEGSIIGLGSQKDDEDARADGLGLAFRCPQREAGKIAAFTISVMSG